MPLKRLNEDWDIEDPNAEIPHAGDQRTGEHELDSAFQKGSQPEALHIENAPKA